jgi:arabinofuranan 3-O-arabinosyltransferase
MSGASGYRARVSQVVTAPTPAVLSSVQRLRLLAISCALLLLTFGQDAGSTAADTKLDLIIDPARFLGRSVRLWDPNGSAGQLQDQAYGYLFPMGPFFLLGKLLQLPPWVIQRSWESALLIAAFLGVVRLARLLEMPGFWPRVAAGLVYALAPRMLTELFSISSELLPVAALPWVLIPLVRGSRTGSPRVAAALSGVALLFAGGINASATLAVLPVPALWLLTRSRGPRRAALLRWWLLSVLLSSLWWLIPLLVLGRYSPPFLDWIESAAVTTSQTSLIAALRGVDHWQAYLGPAVWPAGWTLVVVPAAIAATAGVAALGLGGLLRPTTRHRTFLLSTLLLGLVLVTMGHRSTLGPPFAGTVQSLLDGPGSPFRNVHKFDPLIRLPLAIGFGQLLARGLPDRIRLLRRSDLTLVQPRLLTVLAVLALGAVAIGPAFGGRMVPQPRPQAEPSWWGEAADWLAAHSDGGRALVVPGAGRPNMVWGQTVDDPLQPVARSPWAVRDALPLAQPGYIRYLDSIDQIMARGERSATLSPLLARAGIKYLLVRNDLDSSVAAATRLGYVHTTIANSPGFSEVQHFGADFGSSPIPGSLIDGGAWGSSPAVQIYQVADFSAMVGLLAEDRAVTAPGSSSDALATLAERGVGVQTPVLLGAATDGSRADHQPTLVATDGIRRREIAFGTPGQNATTLDAQVPYVAARAAHDYLPEAPGPLSTTSLSGVAALQASSSGADPTAALNRSAANGPFAAMDGDPATAWKTGSFAGAVGQWLQVTFDRPLDPSGAEVAFATGLGDFPSRIRTQTDAGTVDSDVASDGGVQPLAVPTGVTRTLRITVLRMTGEGVGASTGIATVAVPGVQVTRTLQVPVTGTPDVLAFDVAPGFRAECLDIAGAGGCDPANTAAGEEDGALDRSFTLSEQRSYRVATTVRLRPSDVLNSTLDALTPNRAKASSTQSKDPRVRAGAVLDGDPATAWTASPNDPRPVITVTLARSSTITGLNVTTPAGTPVSRPTKVLVRTGARTFTVTVPADGRIDFSAAVTTKSVSVTVLAADIRWSTDSLTRAVRQLPVGIGEITVRGEGVNTAARAERISIGCNAGLRLQVDGLSLPMHASVPVADALTGQPVLATPCSGDLIRLDAGPHRLRLAGTSVVAPQSLTATADGIAALNRAAPSPGTTSVLSWGSTQRRLQVRAAVDSYLVVRENANAGWRASLNGTRLQSVTLDGWQQGYLVPAGSSGTVTLSFVPQLPFAAGLLAGALAVLALLLLACRWPARRMATAAPFPPPSAEGTAGVRTATVIVAGAGWLLLGLPGLALAGLVLAAGGVVGRWRLVLPGWLPVALLLLLGGLIALLPPGSAHAASDSWFVQLGCAAALLVAATACWLPPPPRRPIEPSRSSLRSIPNHDSAATPVEARAVSTNNSVK